MYHGMWSSTCGFTLGMLLTSISFPVWISCAYLRSCKLHPYICVSQCIQVSSSAAKNHQGCWAAIISATISHHPPPSDCEGALFFPELLVGYHTVGVAGEHHMPQRRCVCAVGALLPQWQAEISSAKVGIQSDKIDSQLSVYYFQCFP